MTTEKGNAKRSNYLKAPHQPTDVASGESVATPEIAPPARWKWPKLSEGSGISELKTQVFSLQIAERVRGQRSVDGFARNTDAKAESAPELRCFGPRRSLPAPERWTCERGLLQPNRYRGFRIGAVPLYFLSQFYVHAPDAGIRLFSRARRALLGLPSSQHRRRR